jgi:hypothetical protein
MRITIRAVVDEAIPVERRPKIGEPTTYMSVEEAVAGLFEAAQLNVKWGRRFGRWGHHQVHIDGMPDDRNSLLSAAAWERSGRVKSGETIKLLRRMIRSRSNAIAKATAKSGEKSMTMELPW